MAKKFNPKGKGYDYAGAKKAGLKKDKSGHLGSLDPKTGKLLKGASHASILKTHKAELARGSTIIPLGKKGRLFSRSLTMLKKKKQR